LGVKNLVLKVDASVYFSKADDTENHTVSIMKFVEKVKETLNGFESFTLLVKSQDFKLYDEPLKVRCL
jgi:hypothetical protein